MTDKLREALARIKGLAESMRDFKDFAMANIRATNKIIEIAEEALSAPTPAADGPLFRWVRFGDERPPMPEGNVDFCRRWFRCERGTAYMEWLVDSFGLFGFGDRSDERFYVCPKEADEFEWLKQVSGEGL